MIWAVYFVGSLNAYGEGAIELRIGIGERHHDRVDRRGVTWRCPVRGDATREIGEDVCAVVVDDGVDVRRVVGPCAVPGVGGGVPLPRDPLFLRELQHRTRMTQSLATPSVPEATAVGGVWSKFS